MGDFISGLFISIVVSLLVYSIFIDPFVGKMEKDIDHIETKTQANTNKNNTVGVIPPPITGSEE